jgi:translation initiation factor 1
MRLFEGTPFDRPPRCEACGALEADCRCPAPPVVEIAPEKQTVRLQVENRKKGKQATVVRGLQLSAGGRTRLLTTLKTACGAGGTLEGDAIEVQGDQRDRIRSKLTELGYRIKG